MVVGMAVGQLMLKLIDIRQTEMRLIEALDNAQHIQSPPPLCHF